MNVTINPQGRDNFHNSMPLRLRVLGERVSRTTDMGRETTWAELTPGQVARIRRHYCGIASCTCNSGPALDERQDRTGAIARAYIVIASKWCE